MKNKIHLWAQHLLPQHLLSRVAQFICQSQVPAFKNFLIARFIKHFQVNLCESIQTDITQFRHFNDFFTRQLKPEVRPIDSNPNSIVSPVDGTISQIGKIEDQTLVQAKGKMFTLGSLLANQTHADYFSHGYFTTLYLAPKDYHRVHMPLAGKLKEMVHIPGKLFSVNPYTTSQVDGLFARNERVVCLFETEVGMMAIILVGAFFVGSIKTVWAGTVTPPTGKKIQTWVYGSPDTSDIQLEKGAQMGAFELGSTVILLFPEKSSAWLPSFEPGINVQMGQPIGIRYPRSNTP